MTDNRERLENDRAALHCAWFLVQYAVSHGGDAALGNDGDPDAVLRWLEQERAAVENSLDALDGAGPPDVPLQVLVEVSGGVAEVTDCPAGVEVRIMDHDNLKASGHDFDGDGFCRVCGADEQEPMEGERECPGARS